MREGESRGSRHSPPHEVRQPVHRPNWLIVADIVITVVLGRASRAKKRAFGKDGLTIVKVGRVRRRTQPERFA
jgi:hypothetical protein